MMLRIVKGTGGMGRAFARFRFRGGVEGAPAVAPFVGYLMGGLPAVGLRWVGFNVPRLNLHTRNEASFARKANSGIKSCRIYRGWWSGTPCRVQGLWKGNAAGLARRGSVGFRGKNRGANGRACRIFRCCHRGNYRCRIARPAHRSGLPWCARSRVLRRVRWSWVCPPR